MSRFLKASRLNHCFFIIFRIFGSIKFGTFPKSVTTEFEMQPIRVNQLVCLAVSKHRLTFDASLALPACLRPGPPACLSACLRQQTENPPVHPTIRVQPSWHYRKPVSAPDHLSVKCSSLAKSETRQCIWLSQSQVQFSGKSRKTRQCIWRISVGCSPAKTPSNP